MAGAATPPPDDGCCSCGPGLPAGSCPTCLAWQELDVRIAERLAAGVVVPVAEGSNWLRPSAQGIVAAVLAASRGCS